jgi:hypothetical protein
LDLLIGFGAVMSGGVGHLQNFGIFGFGRSPILLSPPGLCQTKLGQAANGRGEIGVGYEPAEFRPPGSELSRGAQVLRRTKRVIAWRGGLAVRQVDMCGQDYAEGKTG